MANIWLCNCNENRKKEDEKVDYLCQQKFSNCLIIQAFSSGKIVMEGHRHHLLNRHENTREKKDKKEAFLNYITQAFCNIISISISNVYFAPTWRIGCKWNIADGQWSAFERERIKERVKCKGRIRKKGVKKFRRPFVYLAAVCWMQSRSSRITKIFRHLFIFQIYEFSLRYLSLLSLSTDHLLEVLLDFSRD